MCFGTMTKPLSKYTIKFNDTLSQIARDRGITVDDIKAVNPQFKPAHLIQIGEVINLPQRSDRVRRPRK